MYCPRCNLHSEEYVERCPLCDGRMEVDAVGSGVMKTPMIPPDSEEPTVELLKDQTLRMVKEMEEEEERTVQAGTLALERDTLADGTIALEGDARADATLSLEQEALADQTLALEQEKIVAEAEKELLQIQEEERKPETPTIMRQEEESDEEPFIPASQPAQRATPPLFLGGILTLVLLGALGYYFFFPAEESSTPPSKKSVVAAKKAISRKQVVAETPSASKPGEVPGTTAATEPAKAAPAPPATVTQPVETKKSEMPKPKPEAKQPVKTASQEVPPPPKALVVPPVPPQPQVALSKPEPVLPKSQPVPQKPEAAAKSLGESVKPSAAPPAPVTQKVSGQKTEGAMSALPASSEDGRYSIHVGSFKLKENADEIVERLQKKGYPVLCNVVEIPGKGELYRVKVGYYTSGTEAKQVAAKLKSQEKVFTLVLQR